ncbi:hypothetical protein [Rhizobium phaseoli]|uniref:hypothetical protein n=1 Tax=Rhizobium phaseoli TaxID=396 RepID=UPI0014382FD0|nr:hypothetical protein [Rhizobium phaseoli]NKE92411.1 hypothetical protein [Rhizobium phaseoli]
MELVRRKRPAGGGLMARPTHVYTIEYVATLIGENLELLEEIASNSDNIDYGEMIHVYDGTDEGITTFTDRGHLDVEPQQVVLGKSEPSDWWF